MSPTAHAPPHLSRILRAALPLLVACASGSGAGAGFPERPEIRPRVRVDASWAHYEIRGDDADQVAASLARFGPSLGQHRVFGLTSWSARWDYRMRTAGAHCRVSEPRVRLRVRTLLPRWVGSEAAAPELRARWTAFVAAVRRHELGHRELAVEAGEEIADRLAGMRALSCLRLEERAEARARSVVEEYHRRHRAYDERTEGGRLQGVEWP